MLENRITELQAVANLRSEFLEDVRQSLVQMMKTHEKAMRWENTRLEIASFRAELQTLKGMGKSFGFACITLVSGRFGEFISNNSICLFLTANSEIVEKGEEISNDDLEGVLKRLAEPVPSCN